MKCLCSDVRSSQRKIYLAHSMPWNIRAKAVKRQHNKHAKLPTFSKLKRNRQFQVKKFVIHQLYRIMLNKKLSHSTQVNTCACKLIEAIKSRTFIQKDFINVVLSINCYLTLLQILAKRFKNSGLYMRRWFTAGSNTNHSVYV